MQDKVWFLSENAHPTLYVIQACFKPGRLIRVSQYKHLPVRYSKNNKHKEGKSLIQCNQNSMV